MRSRDGFTLIELMITISIIGILTVTMLPALRTFDRKNKLSVASEQLKGAITEARNYAMAPRFDDTNIDRYEVKIADIRLIPVKYEIGYCRSNASDCEGDNWVPISTRQLPTGVKILNYNVDSTVINAEIGFKVPGGTVVFNGDKSFDNKTTWGTDTNGDGVHDGVGRINLQSVNDTSASIGVDLNSYTGQIMIQ